MRLRTQMRLVVCNKDAIPLGTEPVQIGDVDKEAHFNGSLAQLMRVAVSGSHERNGTPAGMSSRMSARYRCSGLSNRRSHSYGLKMWPSAKVNVSAHQAAPATSTKNFFSPITATLCPSSNSRARSSNFWPLVPALKCGELLPTTIMSVL